jgi:hypothetical protein
MKHKQIGERDAPFRLVRHIRSGPVGEVLTLFFHKFFTVQAGGGPNPGQSHLEIRSQQNHRSCGTIKERSRIRGEIYRCRRAEITRLVHPGDASGDLAIKIKCVLVEKRSCISALFSNAIALGLYHLRFRPRSLIQCRPFASGLRTLTRSKAFHLSTDLS